MTTQTTPAKATRSRSMRARLSTCSRAKMIACLARGATVTPKEIEMPFDIHKLSPDSGWWLYADTARQLRYSTANGILDLQIDYEGANCFLGIPFIREKYKLPLVLCHNKIDTEELLKVIELTSMNYCFVRLLSEPLACPTYDRSICDNNLIITLQGANPTKPQEMRFLLAGFNSEEDALMYKNIFRDFRDTGAEPKRI